MNDHDVVVVGAGHAGLSAASILANANIDVLIVDGGSPRNAASNSAHGFYTQEGTDPNELDKLNIFTADNGYDW